MNQTTTPAVFDGHNDALLKLFRAGGVSAAEKFVAGMDGAIDAQKARAGGFGGGFFAVYVPSPVDLEVKFEEMTKPKYDLPLPSAIDWPEAQAVVMAQSAILFELERMGALRVCRNAADIRAALADGSIAAIYHIEGAEAIDPDLHTLDSAVSGGAALYRAGLEPPTIFGEGVPFRYPATGDIGTGLTDSRGTSGQTLRDHWAL